MTRCGNGGNPTAGFPPFPRTLGNRNSGDFHIPTARLRSLSLPKPKENQKTKSYGAVEKWKSKIRISTFPPSRSACDARKKGREGGLLQSPGRIADLPRVRVIYSFPPPRLIHPGDQLFNCSLRRF